jgi:hypothetical protein
MADTVLSMDNHHRGDQRMTMSHLLADAIQADREREIRARSPRQLGLSSGPRHPHEPESSAVSEPRTDTPSKPVARPRVAWGG